MSVAEFEQLGGDERRGIGQRDEAEPQMGFLERRRRERWGERGGRVHERRFI
jgi:hypothetical protein